MYGGYEDGDIYCWNIKSGEVLYSMKGHTKSITKLAMLNARVLLSASTDHTLRCWDTISGTGEAIVKFDGSIGHVMVHNKIVYVLISNNQIGLFNSENLNHLKTFHFDNKIITSFTVNENFLYIATTESNIEILEILEEKCEPKGSLKGHKDWILTMKIF